LSLRQIALFARIPPRSAPGGLNRPKDPVTQSKERHVVRTTRWMTAAAVMLAACVAMAAEDVKDKTKGDGAEAKAEKHVSASTIDFRTELGLDFPSLVTLGSRIEQCRSINPDPVGLAAAAYELAAMEKVSEKTAKITADVLRKEAVQLALVRNDSKEMKATMHFITDEKAKDELETAALRAEKEEKEKAELAKTGAKTRGVHNELIVKNFSRQWIKVYYNGRYVGRVEPLRDTFFNLHDHGRYFDLMAIGSRGSKWHHHEQGQFRNFTWRVKSLR
jgi:hypothetical protein